jgi:hypothetical protein
MNEGRYAKAEPLFQRALVIKEKAMGPEHLSVANSLFNLASPCHTGGEHLKAEPMFERVLRIYQKALGQKHSTTAERGRS